MSSVRLFVTAGLAPGAVLAGTPRQAHYLGAVMRRRPGDQVRLFNGRDGEWTASITALHRDRALVVVDRLLRPQAPEPDLWLAFALLKRDATDLLVQKATELGVAALLPVLTARSVAARINPARLAVIAAEAAEQSERLTVPSMAAARALPDLLATWPRERRLYVLTERHEAAPLPFAGGPAALLVGPEGGFTGAEVETVLAQPFVTAASLGPRILRAETACIVGLALLQAPQRG